MDFSTAAYVHAGFLLILGLLYLWWAGQMSEGDNGDGARGGDKKRSSIINLRSILILFAFGYIALAHWALIVGLGNTLFLVNQAPCENVLANYTVDNASIMNAYVDTCATRPVPATNERLYTTFLWFVYLEAFGLFWAAAAWFVQRILRWRPL